MQGDVPLGHGFDGMIGQPNHLVKSRTVEGFTHDLMISTSIMVVISIDYILSYSSGWSMACHFDSDLAGEKVLHE